MEWTKVKWVSRKVNYEKGDFDWSAFTTCCEELVTCSRCGFDENCPNCGKKVDWSEEEDE